MPGRGVAYGYGHGYDKRKYYAPPPEVVEGAFSVDTTEYTADDTTLTADRLTDEGL